MIRHYYIGERLSGRLDASNTSVDDIGAYLNVVPKQVDYWLRDLLPAQDEFVRRLANHFDCHLEELINEKGQFLDEQENQVFEFLAKENALEYMPKMLHQLRDALHTRDTLSKGLEERDLKALLMLLKRRKREL